MENYKIKTSFVIPERSKGRASKTYLFLIFKNIRGKIFNTTLYIIFQYIWETVLIHQILVGFEPILAIIIG